MKIVTKYPDGIFSWIDLTTTDIAGAHAFYIGLFGWQVDEQPIGDSGGFYTNFRIDGYTVAGGGQMQPEMQAAGAPSVWVSYINHSDIDAVAARALFLLIEIQDDLHFAPSAAVVRAAQHADVDIARQIAGVLMAHVEDGDQRALGRGR